MEAYIALGLDPARFWDITLRLMKIEMSGAEKRIQRERALVWAGSLLPYQKKPPRFEDFIGIVPDRAAFVREFESRWDRLDASLRRNANWHQ